MKAICVTPESFGKMKINIRRLYVDDLVYIQKPDTEVKTNAYGDYIVQCELAKIEGFSYGHDGELTGAFVRFNNYNMALFDVELEEIICNFTREKELERMQACVKVIEEFYHKRFTLRKFSANRLQRAYLRHYYNPQNPNMKSRLLREFDELCLPLHKI